MAKKASRIFDTDRRIRLGIWGLGRGMSFFRTCEALNIDVVAGCDYVPHMRDRFARDCPGAFVTDNEDDFLAQDFDAVLLATYCPAHAPHAIKALRAGKHVLSEVTAFFTMAEGVALVEAVEASGKVYNLAENYPFAPQFLWLKRKWDEGLFGDLMYAEFEYVHEIRSLAYTYIDGTPVQPGWTLHNWRSWLNYHYYCTHSLGPVMYITGTRPTRVVSLPGTQRLAGYPHERSGDMGGVAPSLIHMSNGAVVRNLMGATTNDVHSQRIWGTLGAAESGPQGLLLRLGGSGGSPKLPVKPAMSDLEKRSLATGHGGGDFWVLYFFARQILTGEKAPWDIYAAADVTIPGIQAIRSGIDGGTPYEVPDFRDRAQRDRYRDDHWRQEALPADSAFPPTADRELTQHFSTTMANLIGQALAWRAYADWAKVADELDSPAQLLGMLERVVHQLPAMRQTYAMAMRMIDAYPHSRAARVLREMLEVGGGMDAVSDSAARALKRKHAALVRRHGSVQAATLTTAEASSLLPPDAPIESVPLPRRGVAFSPVPYDTAHHFVDVRPVHQGKDGLVYVRGSIELPRAGKGRLLYGADGPVRVWVNGKPAGCEPKATNPAAPDEYQADVTWKKGRNDLLFALRTNKGNAWGLIARGVL